MKIVAVMPVRNEDWILGMTLRGALKWVDSAVVLLHASSDRSEEIARKVAEETGRVRIEKESDPEWREMEQRERLLGWAREEGATHLALIDADEMLTANLLPKIRGWFEALGPGQLLDLPMICPWNGIAVYRGERAGPWAKAVITLGVRDHPGLAWRVAEDGYQHHNRPPYRSLLDTRDRLRPVGKKTDGGNFHFSWASLGRLTWKHRHYKMMEVVRFPNRENVKTMDKRYSLAMDSRGIVQVPIPKEWLDGYRTDEFHMTHDPWHRAECERMWKEHGARKFVHLNLWNWPPSTWKKVWP